MVSWSLSELSSAESAQAAKAIVRRRGGSPFWSGERLVFVYVGNAEAVELEHWMDIFPTVPPFEPLEAGGDVWATSVEVPRASRFEYRLKVTRVGKSRSILDPLNRRRVSNPFGRNSEARGPDYVRPRITEARHRSVGGATRRVDVESDVFGVTRSIDVYVPALHDPEVVMYLHDGSDYRTHAALEAIVDNGSVTGLFPPIATVMLDPGVRTTEYAADPFHAMHLAAEVVPAVEELFVAPPKTRLAAGASLGAVAALHGAWTYPELFDGLVLQSGSFVTGLGGPFNRSPVLAPVVRWMGRFHAEPRPLPPRIHMSCGRFDGLIGDNRSFAARLDDRGVELAFVEAADGHDWALWRDQLASALAHVLAGA